MANNEVVVS